MPINLSRIKEHVSEGNFETADLYLAPQGKYFLFVYKIEGKYFAQWNDKAFGAFSSVEDVCFKKGGKVFAFKFSNFSKKLGLIKDSNQDYININGREVGPFSKIVSFRFNEDITYFILYESFGTSYVVINNQKYGGYKSVYKVFFSPDGQSFTLHYKDNGRQYVRINEEILGGYEEIKDLTTDYDNNFYCFIFKKETGEYFARINSNILGPFDHCSDLHYYKDCNSYYLKYKKDGVNFVQINNYVLSGYDSYDVPVLKKDIAVISSVKEKEISTHFVSREHGIFSYIQEYCLSENSEEAVFSYYKMGQYYVIAGDFEYGPYKNVSNLSISPDGKNYCFVFQKQYDNYYVNINGDIFGPYIQIADLKVSNDPENYGFIFIKNARYFVNAGGELHGMYESASNLILSDLGKGYSYKFAKRSKTGPLFAKLQTFVSINGNITEDDAEIADIRTNSLGFKAIVFKRKNNWYINLDGDMFGPFASVSEWRFLPDETLFAFKCRDSQSEIDHLQINGKKYFSRNKNLQIYSPIFSPDKKRFGFIHYSNTHYYVQITDETYGPYFYADFPSFSPDSKIFIFKYELEDGIYLNVNGMDIGPFYKAEYTFHEGKLYISYLQDNMIFIDEITWTL
ncbi:MAG: hypothetical protein JXN63_08815 [Candidatus Delongbacteria bacterium]|nr:hypothetical protein [Candidatus Delongbacteria bacterium]